MDNSMNFERVAVEDARRVLDRVAPARSAKHERRERPPSIVVVEPLADETIHWLESLPAGVAPRALAAQFARIANDLCRLWKRPSRCERYLDDLILDRREGRAGFPVAVMRELGALSAHYAEIYPNRRHTWDTIGKR